MLYISSNALYLKKTLNLMIFNSNLLRKKLQNYNESFKNKICLKYNNSKCFKILYQVYYLGGTFFSMLHPTRLLW